MKKLLTILALLVNLTAIAGESTKKIETYEDMVKKEETARDLERDSYEAEVKAEEAAEKKELKREEKRRENEREDRYIEVKDDAGYDKNNMDKIRERNHRAWDSEQREFDKPWNRDIKVNSDNI